MHDIGADQAAFIAQGEGGLAALYFAAAQRDRTSDLVLLNTSARYRRSDDYPAGMPDSIFRAIQHGAEDLWGTGHYAQLLAPTLCGDAGFRAWWARCERLSTAPSVVTKYWSELTSRDARGVLGALHVPTLVIHRHDDPYIGIDHGRYLAERIPGALYVELDGDDHFPFSGDTAKMLDETESFVTGAKRTSRRNRVLATVLCIDIVGSTSKVSELATTLGEGSLMFSKTERGT
jgi:pimeloyl-ACP methyl ester carboxylesterase